jgi:hypothetical protein
MTQRAAARRVKLISEFQALDISQAEFCRRRNLHPATFSAWLRAVPDSEASAQSRFTECTVAVRPASRGALMSFPGGISVEVQTAADVVDILKGLGGSLA